MTLRATPARPSFWAGLSMLLLLQGINSSPFARGTSHPVPTTSMDGRSGTAATGKGLSSTALLGLDAGGRGVDDAGAVDDVLSSIVSAVGGGKGDGEAAGGEGGDEGGRGGGGGGGGAAGGGGGGGAGEGGGGGGDAAGTAAGVGAGGDGGGDRGHADDGEAEAAGAEAKVDTEAAPRGSAVPPPLVTATASGSAATTLRAGSPPAAPGAAAGVGLGPARNAVVGPGGYCSPRYRV